MFAQTSVSSSRRRAQRRSIRRAPRLFVEVAALEQRALLSMIDSTPPITQANVIGTLGTDGSYTGPVSVDLSATDPDDAPQTLTTLFSVNGGKFQVGNEIDLSAPGPDNIRFFSLDPAGNIESLKSVNLSISGPTSGPVSIQVSANPNTLWPPNGAVVPVTISGTINGTLPSNAVLSYQVTDEYGQDNTSGTLDSSSITYQNGVPVAFRFTVNLQASRDGQDHDGRQYTITVTAKDPLGNSLASASTQVVVPHDQGHGGGNGGDQGDDGGDQSNGGGDQGDGDGNGQEDSQGQQADDNVLPVDTTAPTTQANVIGLLQSNGTYAAPVFVGLSATDPDDPAQALTTLSSVNGGKFEPITALAFSQPGTDTIRFFSLDPAANIEAMKSVSVSIAAPTPPSPPFVQPWIQVTANPSSLWPPDGSVVPVTISGNLGGTLPAGTVLSYQVVDEYGQFSSSGVLSGSQVTSQNGVPVAFKFTVDLQSSRLGQDHDGRQYFVVVHASDLLGNTLAGASTIVTVPHDQGHGGGFAHTGDSGGLAFVGTGRSQGRAHRHPVTHVGSSFQGHGRFALNGVASATTRRA